MATSAALSFAKSCVPGVSVCGLTEANALDVRRATASTGAPFAVALDFFSQHHQYCFVKRPLWLRLVLAVWGLWFATVPSYAATRHDCPAHDPAQMAHSAHSAHSVHSVHLVHAGHTHAAPASPAQHGDQSHRCRCLGDCCSPPVAAVPRPAMALAAIPSVETTWDSDLSPRLPGPRAEHSLPFANGPPTIL